jgi:hypothetical protein
MPISQRYSKWYGKYHPLKLTDLEEEKAPVGVRAFLQNHELTPTAADIVIKSTCKTSKESTIEVYGRYCHDLYKFAVLRGDYCSASLLDRKLCPDSTFPVLPSTICEYID